MEGFSKMPRLRSKLCKDIEQFHKKFKLGYAGGPRRLSLEVIRARYKHQFEEVQELSQAIHTGDMEGTLDALVIRFI